MLEDIRKPYLNMDARHTSLRRSAPRALDFTAREDSWNNITHLTNEERDQIDLQARVILTRCAERVKEMEALEKRMSLQIPFRYPNISFMYACP
jgi:syntaxin 18